MSSQAIQEDLTETDLVHYVAYNQRHLAGIVIGYEENRVDLVIFTNMHNVNGVKNFGHQFQQEVPYSVVPLAGTWHWPEKRRDETRDT